MRSPAIPELVRARLMLAVAAVAGGAIAGTVGHWKVALGFIVGIGCMAAALEVARYRGHVLWSAHRGDMARVLLALVNAAKYAAVTAVLWLCINVLGSPGWSLCAGVGVGVVCLAVAFVIDGTQRR